MSKQSSIKKHKKKLEVELSKMDAKDLKSYQRVYWIGFEQGYELGAK